MILCRIVKIIMTPYPDQMTTNLDAELDWDVSSEDYDDMAKEDKLAYLKDIFNPTSSGFCYNGITMHAYPFKKNHPDAKKLFVVHNSQGTCGRTDPYKMYYDTPEQYARHRHIKLNPEVISKFYERQRQIVDSNKELS